jgi:hypothetical protein
MLILILFLQSDIHRPAMKLPDDHPEYLYLKLRWEKFPEVPPEVLIYFKGAGTFHCQVLNEAE